MREKKLKVKEKNPSRSSIGVIMFVFQTVSQWLFLKLSTGLFGRFFTSYDRLEQCFDGSVAGFVSGAHVGKKTFFNQIRRKISLAIDKSVLIARLERIPEHMLGLNMRMYGTFFLVFGFYSVGMALLKYVIVGDLVDADAFIAGALMVVIAIPMLFVKKSLAWVLRKSAVCHLIFVRLLRIHEDKFYLRKERDNSKYSIALVLGMLLGMATYVVSPVNLIGLGVMLIAIGMVLSLPEVGIMGMLATIPFLSAFHHPTLLLASGVFLTLVSYFVKYLRGKRTMRYGFISVFVALFSGVVLLGGVVSIGGVASLESALVYFIILQVFNLVINLFRTRDDCRHALSVMAVSGIVAAWYGVIQYLLGRTTQNWIDTEMFAYIEGRATSFFDNPNVFGTYLILLLPFVFVFVLYSVGAKKKFLSLFSVAVSIVALVWTWSRGAWLGAMAGAVIFFLIFSYKTIRLMMAGTLCLPLIGSVLPQSVVDRFLSIGNMGDSSTYYRVYTWRGVMRMLRQVWFSGVGVGQAAFEQVYPLFAYAGMQATPHAHNLLMHIMGETGIAGVLVLTVVIVLFAQLCISSIVKLGGEERMTVAAGLCGIVSTLVMGLADNIWYNYRVFFAFWCVMALTVAYISAIQRERRDAHGDNISPVSANININIMH